MMRLALTIGAALLFGALPAKACEDYVEARASVEQVAATQPAAVELSAATEKKKPAKKVAKKKREKVEYMRIAN